MKIKKKQQLTKQWFIKLQNIICNNIEQLEKKYGSNKKFKKNKWKHGDFRIIKGDVIEKGFYPTQSTFIKNNSTLKNI